MSSDRGYLFVVAAPSGGGKTSLINELLTRDPRLTLSVSHTTRQARPGETDGQHYHFVSETEFEQMVVEAKKHIAAGDIFQVVLPLLYLLVSPYQHPLSARNN